MDDSRPEPPHTAPERVTLTGFLDWQRATFALKCAGLTAGQLRERAVPPSGLSLLGLARHLAEVERSWFRAVVDGEDIGAIWGGRDAGGGFAEFDVDDADPGEAFEVWRAECDRSREIVDAAGSLDQVFGYRDRDRYSLRWILVHMIEEYARHNGHADLLRERLDGATGE
ncbi:DinB family protein [Actinomadura kijaniata]|uniref:DinB family protein n=1 Tax=Actinomadura kijaniata TaxID=46161 RepID=UPI000834683F|nr:DinB family protein [Actinomadura kijaniata]